MQVLRRLSGGLALACAVVLAGSGLIAPAAARADWTLTFEDEFNGSGLDLTKWGYHSVGPHLDGYALPSAAVSVAGGALTINTFTVLGLLHVSGQIDTQQRLLLGFEQTYGYFEARVKFNTTSGMWSAFWLQSQTNGVPVGDPATAGVEMDITEHRIHCVEAPAPTPAATCAQDVDISGRVQQALVWDGYGADSKSAVKLSDPLSGLGNGSWHTWGLSWTPEGLTFYYDGTPTWAQSGPISARSQYIVLGSEVGQAFAGAIPAGGYSSGTTNMQVDYVRVWQGS